MLSVLVCTLDLVVDSVFESLKLLGILFDFLPVGFNFLYQLLLCFSN